MAEKDKRFEMENLAVTTTSFSQLLFGDDDHDELVVGSLGRVSVDHVFGDDKAPKMLCFGDFAAMNDKSETALFSETTTTTTKSSVTCSDSSSSASSANNNIGSMSKSNTRKRGGGPDKETVQCTSTVTGVLTNPNHRLITNSKKTKSENPNCTVPMKRKEKLGERIAALQQLVSPFGKSDTASVLHEAMGYIRFLQEQVQVLCSPYLQRFPDSLVPSEKEEIKNGAEIFGGIRRDLRSRGLCLVPTDCTVHLVNDNGADLWSPAMAGRVVSSSTM